MTESDNMFEQLIAKFSIKYGKLQIKGTTDRPRIQDGKPRLATTQARWKARCLTGMLSIGRWNLHIMRTKRTRAALNPSQETISLEVHLDLTYRLRKE